MIASATGSGAEAGDATSWQSAAGEESAAGDDSDWCDSIACGSIDCGFVFACGGSATGKWGSRCCCCCCASFRCTTLRRRCAGANTSSTSPTARLNASATPRRLLLVSGGGNGTRAWTSSYGTERTRSYWARSAVKSGLVRTHSSEAESESGRSFRQRGHVLECVFH